jgi:hypothetical protein
VSSIGDILVKGAVRHPERDAIVSPYARSTDGALPDGAVAMAENISLS